MVELNEVEIYVYLFCNAVSIFVISLFMDVFFERKEFSCPKFFRALFYIMYWVISSAGYLCFQWSPTIMLALTITATSAISITYYGSWKYRISSVAIIIAVQVVCEDMVYYSLVKLHIEQMFIEGLLIVQLLSFMIALLLQKAVDLRKGTEILFGDWISIIIIPLWSIFISVVVLDNCKNEVAIAAGGSSMILIDVLVFYLLKRMQDTYKKQLDIKALQQQNEGYAYQMMLSKTSEERINSVYHDMKNHFLALEHLAVKEDNSEIRKYLKDLMKATQREKQLLSTGNCVLDGFLNVKLTDAINNGVKVETSISVSNELNINPIDISIILGNLLDNALQALKESGKEEQDKRLIVKMHEDAGLLYIRIMNSHNGNINVENGEFKTIKNRKEGHGIGLKNVKQIIDKYHGHLEIEHTDKMFSVEVVLFL